MRKIVGKWVQVSFFIFLMNCGYSSRPPQFYKKKEVPPLPKVLLSGSQFKQTSRHIKELEDGYSHKVIYTFDSKGKQVYFSLSCQSKKKQEILSQRQTTLFIQDPYLLLEKLYFEVPDTSLLILSVSDPPGRLICIEILKTGKYQFIQKTEDYLEVQVDGLFYMYVKRVR